MPRWPPTIHSRTPGILLHPPRTLRSACSPQSPRTTCRCSRFRHTHRRSSPQINSFRSCAALCREPTFPSLSNPYIQELVDPRHAGEIVVHSETAFGLNWTESRRRGEFSSIPEEKSVVFGHSPFRSLFVENEPLGEDENKVPSWTYQGTLSRDGSVIRLVQDG